MAPVSQRSTGSWAGLGQLDEKRPKPLNRAATQPAEQITPHKRYDSIGSAPADEPRAKRGNALVSSNAHARA